jgi:hypothetical protein
MWSPGWRAAIRFLADIEVQKAADLALLVKLGRSLLDPANKHHLPVPL